MVATMSDGQAATNEVDLVAMRGLVRAKVDQFVSSNFDLLFAALCTEDGFVVYHCNSPRVEVLADRLAAISSSLLALAEASMESIGSGKFSRTIVEAEHGHMSVIRARVCGHPAVLSVASTRRLSVGKALYLAERLADDLSSLPRPRRR